MDAQSRPDNAEPTLFSAIVTPHRSLSGTGFVLVMALIVRRPATKTVTVD